MRMIVGHGGSGTSCCARLLIEHGVDFGDLTYVTSGCFENIYGLALNVTLLGAAGGTYADPPSKEKLLLSLDKVNDYSFKSPLYELPYATLPVGTFRNQMREFESRFPDIVWKDPRSLITWEAWHVAVGHYVPTIFVFRHPQSCVQSLVNKRFGAKQTLDNWLDLHTRAKVLWQHPLTILWNFDELEESLQYTLDILGYSRRDTVNLDEEKRHEKCSGKTGNRAVDNLYKRLLDAWNEQRL